MNFTDLMREAIKIGFDIPNLTERQIRVRDEVLASLDPTAGLELPRMLVLRTGHLQRSTAQLLKDDEAGVIRHEKGEYGWIIPIIDNPSNDPPPNLTDLVGIYDLARSVGATWIMLDRDADTVEGLPTWDW